MQIAVFASSRERKGFGLHFMGPLPTPSEPLQLALFGELSFNEHRGLIDALTGFPLAAEYSVLAF